jgi:hypothetical protein
MFTWYMVGKNKLPTLSLITCNSHFQTTFISLLFQDGIYWPTSKNKLDNESFSVEILSEDTSNRDVTTRDFKFVRKSKLQVP